MTSNNPSSLTWLLRWVGVGAAVLCVIFLAAAVADWPPTSESWGTVADWVIGSATAAALLVAAFAYRHQFSVRQDEVDRQKREQIDQVHAWLSNRGADGAPDPFEEIGGEIALNVGNFSDQPVSDLSIAITTKGGISLVLKPIPTVEPGDVVRIEHAANLDQSDVGRPDLHMCCRDASGRWWVRDPNGRLSFSSTPPKFDVWSLRTADGETSTVLVSSRHKHNK